MFSNPTSTPRDTSPESPSSLRRARLLPALVMGVAVPAIFATVALPAYAGRTTEETPTANVEAFKAAAAQSLEVVDAEPAVATGLDPYTGVSAAQLRREAEAAAMREMRSYSGASVRDLLANPPYPAYDPNTIVSIAMQYLGAPYVFGGSSPAGFDCSGFTQFVYAHVGISLPHSSRAQGNMTAIAPEAAMAGDLVVMDGGGHVGIYLGDGTFIHASTPATGVKISKPWGNYWFVRPGI